jgi:hypothetical protein
MTRLEKAAFLGYYCEDFHDYQRFQRDFEIWKLAHPTLEKELGLDRNIMNGIDIDLDLATVWMDELLAFSSDAIRSQF